MVVNESEAEKSIVFATLNTQLQPFNEIFILSGKSSCCNDNFAIYSAASKDYLTRRKIIFYTSIIYPLYYYHPYSTLCLLQ